MDNRNPGDDKRTPDGTTPADKPIIPDPKPTQPGYDDTVEKNKR